MKTIVWFRQDLRLADNPALCAAAKSGPVVPVYIWAPEEEGEFRYGGASRWWLHHSLAALNASLNGRLVIGQGSSLECLRSLIRKTGATRVYWNRRYEPTAISRDATVKSALRAEGLEAESFNAALLREPWTVQNSSRRPFQVFTPFYRHCLTLVDAGSSPLPAPRLRVEGTDGLELNELRLLPPIDWAASMRAAWEPGENGAQRQLDRMLDGQVEPYRNQRVIPGTTGTSRLSPHLHFGEIGPRQILFAVQTRYPETCEPFTRQLYWREFAHHLLYHFPHTATEPLRKEFERFPWRNDSPSLRAWQRGLTGYPIVDAGMRELWTTGWMHNRVRMIVASFLVKQLRIRWQEGAAWFWDTLVDADLANNTLGWQWSAGCGADAAPYFRIFNPVLQGEKFDPAGKYVRSWVPELGNVQDRWIHQPWNMPRADQEAIGFVSGLTYPTPIVDHASARAGALSAFRSLRTQL